MCGIAGFVSFSPNVSVDRCVLRQVRDAMAVRGPDGADEWISADARVGFAHRRLAIIDLSTDSDQPMEGRDGQTIIVFNGEIYNYAQLRADLVGRGYSFRTAGDTEVLLRLYEADGLAMFSKLRGMYSFAIWDMQRKRLLLARDPLGIKPLYYAITKESIWFASQVRALQKCGVSLAEDPAGHVGFFLWGHVPEPYTLFRNIRQIKAGSFMLIDQSGKAETGEHWSSRASFGQPMRPFEQSTSFTGRAQLRRLLQDTVAAHLTADVDVGVFLSAGRDSSTIVGLASEVASRKIVTVTVGFQEYLGTPLDETVGARSVAAAFRTDHHEYIYSSKDLKDHIGAFLSSMDQPTVDGLNTFLVSGAAAKLGLKACLSGVGGDELFGGYSSFRAIPRIVNLCGLPTKVPGLGLASRLALMPVAHWARKPKLKSIVEFGGTFEGAYLLSRALYLPSELGSFLDPNLVEEGLTELGVLERLNLTCDMADSARAKVAVLELDWYMKNQLLRDMDWASMAHSIELRTPLVDSTFVSEFLSLVVQNGWPTKHDLITSLSDSLPMSVGNRAKSGFSIPYVEVEGMKRAYARGLPQRVWAKHVYHRYRYAFGAFEGY